MYSFLLVLTFFLSLFNLTICLSIFLDIYIYIYIYMWWSQIILNKVFCNSSTPIWPNKEKDWKKPGHCLIELYFKMILDSTFF